jgi:anaerobic ribonucleoside-triphosphate reductase
MEDQTGKTQIRVPTEVYSRVSGYYRPVTNWNKGKQQEFSERRYFKVEETAQESSKATCVA